MYLFFQILISKLLIKFIQLMILQKNALKLIWEIILDCSLKKI
jgi:hypothetical protein